MRLRNFAASLFFLAACSHSPSSVKVADNSGPAEGDAVEVPDEFIDESAVTLNGEPDRVFLEQSLELALNPWNPTRVATSLRAFIQNASRKNRLLVRDPVTAQLRRLSLEKIHADRLTPVNDGTAAVCTEFKDDNGDRVDLDFFVIRSDDGDVERVAGQDIHRVNGQARFSYLEKEGGFVRSARNQTPPDKP